jgi:glycosyltransferase involved in cell wall biosynthesis
MKKRILVASECCLLNTGFGIYTKELLQALHKTNNYEVAEFASYGKMCKETQELPWKFYANEPSNKEQTQQFESNSLNQYGVWRFNRVLLDFQPTHVLTLRDFPMDAHIFRSDLRPYYHLLSMAPVDSVPQDSDWIDGYISADGIFTYTKWGKECLDYYGGGLINTLEDAPGCVDYNVFKPVVDKKKHKANSGLSPDDFVVGTVMRNQKRKLFPDLFSTFSQFQKSTPRSCKLLIHTAYPDLGWDIPSLIQQYGLSNSVYTTYICNLCHHVQVVPFRDTTTYCLNCRNFSSTNPRVQFGITHEELASVYNLMDVYVQYSTCEGQGFPIVEAAACGLPTIGVNYSATPEMLNNVGGRQVEPITYQMDAELGSYRTYPNNESLLENIYAIFTQPEEYRNKKSLRYRELAVKNYGDWSKTTNKWIQAIENSILKDKQGQWSLPADIKVCPDNMEADGTSDMFVRRAILEILQDSTFLFSKSHYDWVAALLSGNIQIDTHKWKQYKRQNLVSDLRNIVIRRNKIENARTNRDSLTQEDFIRFANSK